MNNTKTMLVRGSALIGILAAVLMAAPVSAATKWATFKSQDFKVAAPVNWTRTPGLSLGGGLNFTTPKGAPISSFFMYGIETMPVYGDLTKGLETKGWAGLTAAYAKQLITPTATLALDAGYTVTTKTANTMVDGYKAFLVTVTYKSGTTIASQEENYLVTKNDKIFYVISITLGGAKNAYAADVAKSLKTFTITAPETRIATNKDAKFSTRYPSWLQALSVASFTEFTSNILPSKYFPSTSIFNLSATGLIDSFPRQFKTSVLAGVKEEVKEARANIKLVVPTATTNLKAVISDAQPYGLNGYEAAYFTVDASDAFSGLRVRMVFIFVRDGKNGNLYMIDSENTGKDAKRNIIPSPFNHDFRLIAQNFRILK